MDASGVADEARFRRLHAKVTVENNLVTFMRQCVVTASLGLAFLAFLIMHKDMFAGKPLCVAGPVLLLGIAVVLGTAAMWSYSRSLRALRSMFRDTDSYVYMGCFAATVLAISLFAVVAPWYTWKQLQVPSA